jgi:hypothetical protein
MEKEIRNIQNKIKRASEDSRIVEGVAVVFNSDSVDMGFIETIEPSAITDETIKSSDVFAYLNHDESRGVLARSKYGEGTLNLWIEDDGLHYRFEAPKTQLGDELLSYLSRGEITASSFAFTVAEGGDSWTRGIDGSLKRHITKINRLFDVSPVFQPAYETTSVAQRKYENIKTIMEKLDALSKKFSD